MGLYAIADAHTVTQWQWQASSPFDGYSTWVLGAWPMPTSRSKRPTQCPTPTAPVPVHTTHTTRPHARGDGTPSLESKTCTQT